MGEQVKKPGGNRNRKAGHTFERDIVKLLRDIGFEHVVTTRSESRGRDAQGIDIMNKDELVNGRFPYNIQCKNMVSRVDYHALLKNLPDTPGTINVVLHKFTEKKKGGGFHPRGHYAIINMEDFLEMIKQLQLIKPTITFV